MISLATCRKILQQDGIDLTDTEIERMRDFLYLLADIKSQALIEENMLKNCDTNLVYFSTDT